MLISIGAAVSLVAGWWRWVRPRYRRTKGEVTAIRDSILGRDAIRDSITGREIEPALPGVGVRLAATEEHLGVLAEAVASLAQNHVRVDDLERRVGVHDEEIAHLKAADAERIVNRVESVQLLRTMEEAIKAEPDVVVEPEDD